MAEQKRFVPMRINVEFLGELQTDLTAIERVKNSQHSLVLVCPENLCYNAVVVVLCFYRLLFAVKLTNMGGRVFGRISTRPFLGVCGRERVWLSKTTPKRVLSWTSLTAR